VAGQHPQARTHRKQARRLAVHQLHAIGFGDVDPADALKLHQLAFDHDLGEPDEQVEDLKLALAQGDLECLHVEPVACQDAGVIAPFHVGRGAAAPRLGAIDDIVMQESSGVDELNHRAQLDGRGSAVSRQLGGEQQQRWPEALSAAGLQVLADGRHRVHGGDRFRRDLFFDLFQLVLDQVENLARRDGLTHLAQIHGS